VIKEYSNLPEIECYVSELNQVFMNILVNAIDALADKRMKRDLKDGETLPCIKISTNILDSKYVAVSILDNGMGIMKAFQNQIFDPFFTTKPVGEGTGLGLYICHQIVVQKHGGKLKCISRENHSTEFIIELPIGDNQDLN
jgi:signal transduction histidine kinase